jgi:pyruvate dehydrogenase E1 component alpha subunit
MGHEIGNEWLAERHVFPLNISIAGHIPHATGMAWASKLKGESKAFVCHFGDGSTSEGDFHEGLNFAGVFDVPAVFFCNNNQWAISIPRERQTASETIAQKARAYGFDGVQVDGMDPLAVYQVTREAVEKAKHPDDDELRPTLVEAVQYRFGAHTTADDPSVYRKEAEVEEWRRKDPIPRLETFLRERGLLDDEQVDAIEAAVAEEVADLIEAAEEFEPDPEQLFENAYAEATPRVREQRAYFQALRERHGDDALLDEH